MSFRRISTHNGCFIERLENRIAPAGFIFAAGRGVVAVFADQNQDGAYETMVDNFVPFPGYKGPVLVATGDFNADGNAELITAKAAGKAPVVKIWDVGGGGQIAGLIDTITPSVGTSRGVSVAAGDINADGKSELFVGAGPGGPSTVLIYGDTNSNALLSDNLLDQFTAFPATFKGGVKLATGNTTSTGGAELIAGNWKLGGKVRVFTDSNLNQLLSDDATQLEEGTPFGLAYRGGVNVASGAITGAGNGGADVIVSKPAGKPIVLIFADANNNQNVFDDAVFDTLLPKGAGHSKGAAIAAGDTDNSGFFVEVITAPTAGFGSTVRIFDDTNDAGALLSDNASLSFQAFAAGFAGGFNLAFGKVTNQTASMNRFPQSIADSSTLNDSIFVSGTAGIIRDLDISLDIYHTFNSDLDITLTHVGTNTSVILFDDVGGTNEGFFIRLDDDSLADISSATNPKLDGAIRGTFNLEGSALLSVFEGLDASGEWRLTITDDTANDFGTLFNWSLHFSY